MKAIIERKSNSEKVAFRSLEDGDWFVDEDGDLCIKQTEILDTHNGIVINEYSEVFAYSYGEDELVQPVQVTISY